MTGVELRYLMAGSTPAEVRAAAVELAAAMNSLAADVPCVHQPEVTGRPDLLALTVRVHICADGPAPRVLQVARMAVYAAARDAQVVIKEVPGTHRLGDATTDADVEAA